MMRSTTMVVLAALALAALALAGCANDTHRQDAAGAGSPPVAVKDSAALSLEIAPTKKAYAPGERVMIDAVMTNRSHDTVAIDNRFLLGYEERPAFERTIYFKIFKPEGKRYDLPADHQSDIDPIAGGGHVQRLAPGETAHAALPLTPLYKLDRSGSYSVQAVYEAQPVDSVPSLERGPLVSNMASFTIGE